MKYRRLGKTGLYVSEIGFGGWGIGGDKNGAIAYGPTDDRESLLALHRAFELGFNFYDVSDFYGFGHSECLVGEALKEVRSQVVIATKVGFLDAQGTQDFSPEHIRQSIERSLQRLQTDYIDLYQLHSPSMEILEQDNRILSTLQSLQTEGKIRSYGISIRSPDDGWMAVHKFGFKCIQVNFSLVDQRARENGLFAACEKQDVGVIIRTPLCFGFLSGSYSGDEGFAHSDHRSRWSPEQLRRWSQAHTLFSVALVHDKKQTPAQTALRFCLSYPCVSTVIPGMLTREHVEENVLASSMGLLLEEERVKIQEVYQQNRFFTGN
jgi:aryl-alcohol dehydrogenase-like predicted oxidoreductase